MKSSVTKTKNSFDGDEAEGLSENNSSSDDLLEGRLKNQRSSSPRIGRSPSPELQTSIHLQKVDD